jgi:hypothetical protein
VLKKIYDEHELILGRIFYDAKCRIISQYFPVDSLYGPALLINLLGDPALRLKYGPPVPVEEAGKAIPRLVFLPLGRQIIIPARGSVAVYDPLGQLVYKDPDAGRGDRIDLPAGVYFVRLSAVGLNVIEKVVIVD